MSNASHASRVAARQAVNGQPNGYKPVSEAELQASKLQADIKLAA